MKAASNKSWLVRSSGIILGPYSLEEMIQALSEKRIAIIDEVRSPSSRWSFIREHPEFANVVQFLREQQNQSKDDTAATFIGTKTTTVTITTTEEIQDGSPTVAVKIPGESSTANSPAPAKPASKDVKPVQYASPADPKMQKMVEKESRRSSMIVWLFLIVIVVGGIFAYQNLQQEQSKSLTHDDYIRLAKSDQSLGNYERALQFLRKADAIKTLDLAGQLLLAPRMMVVENQNIQARRLLEQTLVNYPSQDNNRIQAESLIALSYLREGQLEEAEKRYQEILLKNAEYEPAQVNIIEILILKGDFETAYGNLTKLMREKIKDPCLIIYRSLVSYRLFDVDRNKDKLELSLEDLKRFQEKSNDFRPEVLLIQAAIQQKMKMTVETKNSLRTLISTYPDITKQHHHNELIHREILGWKYLQNICQILMDGSEKDSVESKGLLAFCAYQQGDLKTAVDTIENAGKLSVDDNVLYGLRAFLLFRSGRPDEAKALLVLGQKEKSVLLKSVEAEICETENDIACSEAAWKEILNSQDSNILALAGLAKQALQTGNKETAADYVTRAWLKSSNFRPIMEIKDQLEQR